jgi:hypothetical protein
VTALTPSDRKSRVRTIVEVATVIFAAGAIVASTRNELAALHQTDVMLSAVEGVTERRVDSLTVQWTRSVKILEGLGRVTCQDKPTRAATAGLPCRELLGER